MKCCKCGYKEAALENVNYCPNCGHPVKEYKDEARKELHKVTFDAYIKSLYVNGIRFDTVRAFSLKCVDRKCTLTVTKDDIYEAEL